MDNGAALSLTKEWWNTLVQEYNTKGIDQLSLFQKVSRGIELFRMEEYRKDPYFVKLWLCYLETHLYQKIICVISFCSSVYGDEEEVRRLYKYLKSEHVGLECVEMYLHHALFELKTGKSEKCMSILEAASKLFQNNYKDNEVLRRVMVEFKLLGTFRLEPLIETPNTVIPPPTPISNLTRMDMFTPLMPPKDNNFMIKDDNIMMMTSSIPPTPISRSVVKKEELPKITEDNRRDSVCSTTAAVPRVSPDHQIGSSAMTRTRIRRLGNLGPPKRAIVTPIASDSPNDSTVPRVNTMNEDVVMASRGPSIPNTPSKLSKMELTIDKENMSLTTISPTNISSKQRKIDTSNDTMTKSRSVKVNGKSYKVLQMVGRGGSSKVFKVLSTDNQIFALKKVSLSNLDETTLSGYLNEIELIKSLMHADHIIKLYDYEINREHDNLYMLMEYGETDLSKLLKERNRKEDFNFMRYMFQQMLMAVRIVHEAKIVHCDIKPANFLLVGGTLKLIDFGISKAIMNDTTNIVRENQVGTVNYMSPEAIQESNAPVSTTGDEERGYFIKIGRGSDVWSLGCILYEMAYGKPPFAHLSVMARLHKIVDTKHEIDYPPVKDPFLLQVMKSCLLRNPKDRPTIDELLSHPFLAPSSCSTLPPESTLVTRQQLLEMMEKFSKYLPQMDPSSVADRIFSQWKKHTDK